ncbi:MAG TPA: putative lipid II flippase FtsW [Ktedonobacteraceae bacterium]|nr:putative lipid II flippase FtsW [Ktedonobacteraceae bacterium]
MQPDKLRQRKKADEKSASRRTPFGGGGNREQREDLSIPVFRSPALESAQRQKAQVKSANKAARRAPFGGSARRTMKSKVTYAADDTLYTEAKGASRKRPYLRSRVSNAGLPAAVPPLRVPSNERRLQSASLSAPVQVISEEEEKKLAALEMQLPRVAGKIDSALLVVVLALVCIGLVMVYSASAFIAVSYYHDVSYFFQKQLLGALLGLAAMLVTMRVDYRLWRRFSLMGLLIVFPLLVIVLKFGTTAYGASRWLTFGSFLSFQPSELAKLMLALYFADWLARKGNQVGTFLYGLAPFVILVGAILGLVLLENDMGTAVVIAGMAAAMFFTAGANISQFLLAMGCGSLVFMTQAFRGYRYFRMMGFLDPFSNIASYNLQLYQSLLALGSGGWLGLGLGASRQKTGYLPLPHIDSIFAIIGEELGFIGCAVVVLLFLWLAFRGFRLARRAQDVYGALLATGITTWLVLQVIVNVGSTTGSMPYTGVPLPFISYGGSSLVVSMAAVGVLLNISRYIREPEDPSLLAFSRYSITKTMIRRRAQ